MMRLGDSKDWPFALKILTGKTSTFDIMLSLTVAFRFSNTSVRFFEKLLTDLYVSL